MASTAGELPNINEDNLAEIKIPCENYTENQYGMRKNISDLVLLRNSKVSRSIFLSRKVL
jgi:hypothetical protein